MIKTFLPDDLSFDPEIDRVYSTLARKAKETLGVGSICCNYKGEPTKLNSQESIKAFLLAGDFYNYKFNNSSHFLTGLLKLHGNTLINGILNGSSKTQGTIGFCSRYPLEKCPELYGILRMKYSDLSIASFRKENLKDFPGSKEREVLRDVFAYKHLSFDGRHGIITKMDVPVCPYCNMNYTLNFGPLANRRTTADLDHFYLKSEYPEYSLCLHNFIPSCPVCNSKLKGRKSMRRDTHIFPHEESFEGKARFEIADLTEVIVQGKKKLKVKLAHIKDDKRVENSAKIFKIDELYEFHNNFVYELLEKVIIYNESYRNELLEKETVFGEDVDIKRFVFGADQSEEQYSRESLGKLRMDILKQLGIYG